jgi:hypothetical protein
MFLCFVDHCENHVSVLQKVRWVVVIRAECDETRDQPMRAYSAPHSTVRSERLVTIRCPCTLSRTRGLGPGFSPLAAPPPDLSPRSVLLRERSREWWVASGQGGVDAISAATTASSVLLRPRAPSRLAREKKIGAAGLVYRPHPMPATCAVSYITSATSKRRRCPGTARGQNNNDRFERFQ